MSRCFYFFSLLLAVVSSNALANDPPQLDIEQRYMARVGELFNLNIAPTDSSGMVPGVYLVNPPEGSTFSDQGDGTRAFQWIPPVFGSEQRTLEFVVIDPADSALRSTITTTLDIAPGPVDARDSITLNIDFAPSTTVSIGTSVSFVVTPRSNDGVVPNLRLVTELPGAQFVDNFDGTRTFVWDNPTEGFHRIEFLASHPDISSQRRFESVDLTVIQGGDSVDAPIFDPVEYAPEVSVDTIVSFNVGARSSAGVPWLSVQDTPAASFFTDNRDGTRNFSWVLSDTDIGTHDITFVARNPLDPSISTLKTIQITVVSSRAQQTLDIDPIESSYTVAVNSRFVLPLRASFPDGSAVGFRLNAALESGATLESTGEGTADFIWTTPSTPGNYNFNIRVGHQDGSGVLSNIDINFLVVSTCTGSDVPLILYSNCIAEDNQGILISDKLAESNGLTFNDIEVFSAGDFNGDGFEDWVFPLSDFASFNTRVRIVPGTAAGISSNINISELSDDETISFAGSGRADKVTALGDINADGYDDLAFSFRSNHRIVFGRPASFGAQFSVTEDSSDIGFNIGREFTLSSSPIIEGIGDFNGDSIDDLAIAYDPFNPDLQTSRNSLFVYYGSSSLSGDTTYEDIQADSGRVYTDFEDFSNLSALQRLGDVDNDGYADIAITQRLSDESQAHIIYGQPASENFLASVSVPDASFSVIREIAIEDHNKARFTLSAGGDIDGDGYADLAAVGRLTHPDFDSLESTHAMVLYGAENRFSPIVDLVEYGRSDNSERLTFIKEATRFASLESFDIGGDMNGDGRGDIAIAMASSADLQFQAEVVYVLNGRAFERELYLDTSITSDGRIFAASADSEGLGRTVDFIGDINADGIDDLFIGSEISFPKRQSWIGFGLSR